MRYDTLHSSLTTSRSHGIFSRNVPRASSVAVLSERVRKGEQAAKMDKQAAYDLVVEELVTRFEIERERIAPDALLFNDLGLDSIDALDMLAVLDKEWKVVVNEEQAKKIRTVQDVVDYIIANVSDSVVEEMKK